MRQQQLIRHHLRYGCYTNCVQHSTQDEITGKISDGDANHLDDANSFQENDLRLDLRHKIWWYRRKRWEDQRDDGFVQDE